jgi:hypothetical protein
VVTRPIVPARWELLIRGERAIQPHGLPDQPALLGELAGELDLQVDRAVAEPDRPSQELQ